MPTAVGEQLVKTKEAFRQSKKHERTFNRQYRDSYGGEKHTQTRIQHHQGECPAY